MRWTPEQKAYLSANYRAMTAEQLAADLGASRRAVYAMARKLRLNKPQPSRIVLDLEQRLWLKLNYPHIANKLCALRLGVSERTVRRIALAMGLRKTAQFMAECQAHTARKARESHLRNGTYPPKGVVNANLAKGEPYRFKPKKPAHTTNP